MANIDLVYLPIVGRGLQINIIFADLEKKTIID